MVYFLNLIIITNATGINRFGKNKCLGEHLIQEQEYKCVDILEGSLLTFCWVSLHKNHYVQGASPVAQRLSADILLWRPGVHQF